MDLVGEICEHVAAYLAQLAQLDDLRDWIADASELADEMGSVEARRLSAQVWRLVSEHGYGHRSDESLQAELARLLTGQAAHWAGQENMTDQVTSTAATVQMTGSAARTAVWGYQPGVLQLGST
jgi:hypothetical protein